MHNNEKLAIFLATSGHSGVDRVMKNLISEFARRGLVVDLLHIGNHGPYLKKVPAGVRIVELGVCHVNSSLLPLVRYLRREHPYALLSDKDRVNRLALLARRLAGTETRVTVRIGTTVSENLARRGWLHRQLQYLSIRYLYPWADAIIFPSREAAEDLAGIDGLTKERIRVVPSPVSSSKVLQLAQGPVEHPWFVEKGEPIILGAGELCARKDFATLIKAFAKVRQRIICKLVILGEGRQRQHLANLVRNLGIQTEVSMPGFVTNPYAYMSKASLFVLSSRCEGAPVVLIEALAVGVPVVSTDCRSGPREILQDGRLGPLVPVGDANALAQAILATLDNPLDAQLLKSGAAPFSVETSANQYLAAMGLSG
jgi:glycosyltransferase involved in cell wall biosynthesis